MIDPKVARARISGCKARGVGYIDPAPKKSVESQEFGKVYMEYEEALQLSNMLDYDDLLLRCVDLLRDHPSCVSNIEAVLIDEFQDTNIVQFDLMRLFSAERKRITIVGDPDQSIYGFRAAEIKNYKRMLHQYPDTVTIALEENYRSSGAILLSALSIIKQDSSRLEKSLQATHGVGTQPVLRRLAGAHKEAEWIVMEIQRCMGLTGCLLDLNDFAILLRSSALSRLIESALAKSGIAYRMVGGLRFYDRMEIKLVLDYLRVISQPSSNDALARIINTPSRRIGDSTIKDLLEEAETSKVTLWQLVLDSVQGRRSIKTRITKGQDQGLSELVNIVLTAQKKISSEKLSIKATLDLVLDKLDMETWLKEKHNDATGARWDNIQELVTQAADFQDLLSTGYEDEALPEIDGLEQTENTDYLTKFLANVALASEVKKNEEEEAKPQLTISTIHAAKGLEWPVVFIPATYQGSIPHSRADDLDEERRLLYVAMTRAKALLYMSCPMKNSQGDATTLSPFLIAADISKCLDQRGPSIQSSVVQSISQILRRGCPPLQSIHESSALLQSIEDDQFPLSGEEREDLDVKWKLTQGSQKSDSQQPTKRRKIDLDSSSSDSIDFRTSYITTMVRASTFTSTTMAGFVNAGKLPVQTDVVSSPEKPKKNSKSKVREDQGTLFNFLGKAEPQLPPPKKQAIALPPPVISQFNRPRIILTSTPTAIDPHLASHRLELKPGLKSRPMKPPAQTHQNEYSFLSSSPPRKIQAIQKQPAPERPAGLTAKPAVMTLTRPPLSMHNTTQDRIKTDGPKKALGMRRTVHLGVGSQKVTKFKPPSMKRP